MFQCHGIWLPDGEEAFSREIGQENEGKPTYQYSKFLACLPYIKDFEHAVDVGAHVGLWTLALASKFERVTAFEPVRTNRDCWIANLKHVRHTWLIGSALGERTGTARIHVNSGGTANAHISDHGSGCLMFRFDEIEWEPISFIKIDAEGYELPIIRGAEETIRRDRPTMIIEQKGHAARYGFGEHDAIDLVCKWGAEVVKEIRGDFICRFP